MHREDAMASVDHRLDQARLIEKALIRIRGISSSRSADEVTYRFGLATGYIVAILHAGVIDEDRWEELLIWSRRGKNPTRFHTEHRAGLTYRWQHIFNREPARRGRGLICMGVPDEATMAKHPQTPDGRYFIVKEMLWRCANPSLSDATRRALVGDLMRARRDVKKAKSDQDEMALMAAREAVDTAKVALGERGPVWWADGSPDYNRHKVTSTPYAEWFASQTSSG
jgi:hypothetical protein